MKLAYRILLALASIGITLMYAMAPPAQGFREPGSARILFFHAPEAMLCIFFFGWAAIMAGRYLLSGKKGPKSVAFDIRSMAANEVGFLLCFLATVTGMVFAYEQWGAAWDWDPRQVTILIQLLIYAAYFALRSGFTSRERSAANAGAYCIFAFLTVPFLLWIVPRLSQIATKHAGANGAVVGGGLDPTYRTIFYSCAVVIGLVGLFCYKLRVREATEAQEAIDNEISNSSSSDSRVVQPVRLRGSD
ncbi:MAG TPA: cytochrome c biogenesis protein CcsA [Fimbriimonadales bacterium]|nr:cytochrome c biogenesis protein CcsA [Fimbriimonadales bacterium]